MGHPPDIISIVPQGASTIVVSELPLGGDHPMHPFLIDSKGAMYIDVASASNSCQLKNRTLKSPGAEPCIATSRGAGAGASAGPCIRRDSSASLPGTMSIAGPQAATKRLVPRPQHG